MQVAPKTLALQDFAAAELHARGTALPQPLEWLTAERVQQLVRSLDRSREVARAQRMSTVREGGVIPTTVFGKGVSGTYRVQLAVAGQREGARRPVLSSPVTPRGVVAFRRLGAHR